MSKPILFALLVLLPGCALRETDEAAEFDKRVSSLIRESRSTQTNDGSLVTDAKFFERMVEKCETETNLTPTQAACFRAMRTFYAEGIEILNANVAAWQDLEHSGGLMFADIATLPTLTDIQNRERLFHIAKSAVDDLSAFESNSSNTFRRSLVESRVSDSLLDGLVDVFEGVTINEQRKALRESDKDACDAAQDAFDLLINEWGNWSASIDGIRFSSHATFSKWDSAMKRLMDAKSRADAPLDLDDRFRKTTK